MKEIPMDGEDEDKTWLPINLSSRVERSFSHSYFSASTQTALFFLERGEEEDSQKHLANKLLNSLPEINRQIFKAVIMEEESYKSVAERFKLPIGTIMSKIFYIKQKLRREAKNAIRKIKK
jgi:DNA-directed RNA polymerase specialized sigma24 family protein